MRVSKEEIDAIKRVHDLKEVVQLCTLILERHTSLQPLSE